MVVGDVALGHKDAKAEISQSIPETHLEHCLLACCPFIISVNTHPNLYHFEVYRL